MKKQLSIGNYLLMGFGLVVTATAFISIWSFLGINSVVKDAEEVIHGNQMKAEIKQRELDHLNWSEAVNDYLFNDQVTHLKAQTDPHQCGFGKWYYGEERQHMEELAPSTQKPLHSIEEWHNKLHASAIKISEAEPQLAKEIYFTETKTSLDNVRHYLNETVDRIEDYVKTDQQMLHNAAQAGTGISISAIISIIIGIAAATYISMTIRKKLTRISKHIENSSCEVASASNQVAAASQNLAEGASEQAAGLEETSSSLEEMTAMTKTTSSNAQQADTLAKETSQTANSGSAAMQKMNGAIQEIQDSSAETAKIIKVIDEIAFQTNLLALNAAVEAARAGEAGKGFAVVAEEVRNLAQRSAEAARTTSELIKGSVEKADSGGQIAGEVNEALELISANINKTAGIIAEISVAAEEQAQGIDQINTAITSMDQITQSNAANAEESASSSSELKSQAESMNHTVGELTRLVNG